MRSDRCYERVGNAFMKIRRFEVTLADLPLREGYRIANQTISFARNVLVRAETDAGVIGFGGAAPFNYEGGESDESCLAALDGPLRELALGAEGPADPSPLANQALLLAADSPAARAALDTALWDLAARKAGIPLVRFWGGTPKPLPTSVTIGVCGVAETLAAARSWIARGFRIIKVKIGEDVSLDAERLHELREALGPGVLLRVDGNQGYSLEDARTLLRETEGLGLEMLEQPLDARDLAGMRALRGESRVPIVADEAAGTIEECVEIVERGAAHGINIKLMKCGGPSAARIIHDHAHAAGLSLMLGCNDETRISIAAAAHLALAMPGLKYADLDGHMDLVRDPASGGFEVREGCLHVSGQPGLGVEASF
jgi:L-alanine-DL-glutamate epimerase-like enolase superfamily enzyme